MVVGLLTLEINIPQADSLKGKRAVLNKVKSRVRNSFNVSIAEVEANDVWNYSCLGICIIANQQRFANQVLDKVIDFVEDMRVCGIEDHQMDFLTVSQ